MVKNLPAMQETSVRSLGWGDPLEKGMATHSCFPFWRIPRRGAWWATYSPLGLKESDTTEQLTHITLKVKRPSKVFVGCDFPHSPSCGGWMDGGALTSPGAGRVLRYSWAAATREAMGGGGWGWTFSLCAENSEPITATAGSSGWLGAMGSREAILCLWKSTWFEVLSQSDDGHFQSHIEVCWLWEEAKKSRLGQTLTDKTWRLMYKKPSYKNMALFL